MAGSIQTAWSGGSSGGALATGRDPGEAVADWIDRHFDEAAPPAPSDTTQLTTSWTCSGSTEQVVTTREPGESWRDFWSRHRQAAEDAMADCPPE